jgi:hypothetical protein
MRLRSEAAVGADAGATPGSVRAVAHIYREFLIELRERVRCGVMRPLVDNDEDATGVDFAFAIEVRPEDYETAIQFSSDLEAKYYTDYKVNFLVVPEAM